MKSITEVPASPKSPDHAKLGVLMGAAAWVWFWFFMDATRSAFFKISLFEMFTNEKLMGVYGLAEESLESGHHYLALAVLMFLSAGIALSAGGLIGTWFKK